ncbi:hypothetical protein RRF57_006510 [Xylaria bambusicola]|uniref:Uncharacterized protein n=1 Tax=Xylaria bambusicola TaxID=326684 RepID=A0AAN7UEG0_9PEZI
MSRLATVESVSSIVFGLFSVLCNVVVVWQNQRIMKEFRYADFEPLRLTRRIPNRPKGRTSSTYELDDGVVTMTFSSGNTSSSLPR